MNEGLAKAVLESLDTGTIVGRADVGVICLAHEAARSDDCREARANAVFMPSVRETNSAALLQETIY